MLLNLNELELKGFRDCECLTSHLEPNNWVESGNNKSLNEARQTMGWKHLFILNRT